MRNGWRQCRLLSLRPKRTPNNSDHRPIRSKGEQGLRDFGVCSEDCASTADQSSVFHVITAAFELQDFFTRSNKAGTRVEFFARRPCTGSILLFICAHVRYGPLEYSPRRRLHYSETKNSVQGAADAFGFTEALRTECFTFSILQVSWLFVKLAKT